MTTNHQYTGSQHLPTTTDSRCLGPMGGGFWLTRRRERTEDWTTQRREIVSPRFVGCMVIVTCILWPRITYRDVHYIRLIYILLWWPSPSHLLRKEPCGDCGVDRSVKDAFDIDLLSIVSLSFSFHMINL
ncbi:Protein of unknown function [Pyronema omphalodes CBS 100304]|uniref:Uncharacterized protein n=1 Tax=Pyronema omphalodes (strain CBS 100304) TaxID=1076935 RepID=U4L6F5_PYROM|nr:Protein of unknown function [Pyronema omphalodes CBS 100304]